MKKKIFEKTLVQYGQNSILTFFSDGTYRFSSYAESDGFSYWKACFETNRLFFRHHDDGNWHPWQWDYRDEEGELLKLVNDFIFEDIVLEAAE